jgi:hypothetical protein
MTDIHLLRTKHAEVATAKRKTQRQPSDFARFASAQNKAGEFDLAVIVARYRALTMARAA